MGFSRVNQIKKDGDEIICMVHYPPFNARREDSLFTELFEQNGVRRVIYGHLHGNESRADAQIIKNGITYYLTSCDQVNNKLTLIAE